MADVKYEFHAGSLDLNNANPPSYELDDNTSSDHMVWAFNRATEEYVEGLMKLPSNLGTGNVTLRVDWRPRVHPGTGEDVIWKFYYKAVTDAESIDQAYSSLTFAASTSKTTDKQITQATKTETVANLGWAANDLVYFQLSRDATNVSDTMDNNATADNDDAKAYVFDIDVPVS